MSKNLKNKTASSAEAASSNEILVVTNDTAEAGLRGGGPQPLKVDELAVNVNLFVQQMGKVLENTPETVGKFRFEEFEIHAEVSADGTIAILGSGVHAGIGGGLRFVFRRS